MVQKRHAQRCVFVLFLLFVCSFLNGCAEIVFSKYNKLYMLGKYEEVIGMYEQGTAREKTSTEDLVNSVCPSYLNSNRIKQTFACIDRAEKLYQEGDKNVSIFSETGGYSDGMPAILALRGKAYERIGDQQQAEKLIRQAAALLEAHGSKGGKKARHTLEKDLVIITARKGDIAGARAEYEKTMAGILLGKKNTYTANFLEYHPSLELGALTSQAEMLYALGDYQEIVELEREVKRHNRSAAISVSPFSNKKQYLPLSEYENGEVKTLMNDYFVYRAKSLMQLGRKREARKAYIDLLAHRDKFVDWEETIIESLYDLARIEAARNNLRSALKYCSRAVEMIEETGGSISMDQGRVTFSSAKHEVFDLLVNLYLESGDIKAAFEQLERSKSYALVALLRQQLDTEQRTTANEIDSLATTAVSLKDIKGSLQEKELLVQYFISKKVLHLFMVDRQTIRHQEIKTEQLTEDVINFRQAILSNTEIGTIKRLAKSLHKQLIEPLGKLTPYDNLTVIPYKSLHYLPFSALYDGRKYLVERLSLRQLPSSSVGYYLGRRQQLAAEKVVLIGNPTLDKPGMELPGSQIEIQAINKLYPDAQCYLNEAASETNFLANKNYPAKMVHIASHAVFDNSRPYQSALYLAADRGNDGVVRLEELYSMRIPTQLLVLSGCETGLANNTGGDELIGLIRGFLVAGVNSLLVSQWEISDDATAHLMHSFHEQYAKNGQLEESLRNAQLQTRKKYPHPYYWASFYSVR